MSSTYYFSDLCNIVSRFIPKIADSDIGAFACNIAINKIHSRYDFREYLTTLPPFFLIPNAQDFGTPFVAVPSDFLGLREAYLVQLNSTPVYRQPLGVLKDLQLTQVCGLPQDIGYQPDTQSFRVFPRVPLNIGAPNWLITGTYKKRPTKLTSTTISSTLLPFEDIYLQHQVEALKWAAWQLSGDPRAGGVQTNKHGQAVFTGQYAAMIEAIDNMAESEGLNLGDVSISPQEQLAVTSMNYGIGFRIGW